MVADPLTADRVRERALDLGFDLVGFGSAQPFDHERELILEDLSRGHMAGMGWITPERVTLSCDPEALLPGARSIVGLGMAYGGGQDNPPDYDRPHGRVARYARGRDYHDVIRPRLRSLADTIVELFGPDTRCRSFVDTGPLVDRAAAVRAGLGFIGKNTCLLTGRYGSYVVLSAILTTAELPPDPVSTRDCGSCRACIDACPTEAIVAPGQLDATRCISYLTIEHRGPIPIELRPKMGNWVFGCDICQEVCPWNHARRGANEAGALGASVNGPVPSLGHARRGAEATMETPMDGPGPALGHARRGATHPELQNTEGTGNSLDLIEVLGLDDVAFRARFHGTPLTRPKRAGLLRNTAVALGNQPDSRAVPALLGALSDHEPLVRGHAAWAVGQLDPLPPAARAALGRALAVELDDDVRREMAEALGSDAAASTDRRSS